MARNPIVPTADTADNGATDFHFGANVEADTLPASVPVLPSTSTPPAAGPDPFDPASLRLTPDSQAGPGVRKILMAVPVRKPDKSWFLRVHPSESYRLPTALIEVKED